MGHGGFMVDSVEAGIKKAQDILDTARSGYEDLVAIDKSKKIIGLRNLIVFGRSVTFVLQNLRSKLPEGEFDKWYAPKQDELKGDAVMKHFVTLRNELEKQGSLPISTNVQISEFSFSDIEKYPRPPGTVGFFIGDQFGGSGFEVELYDGTKEKYYVDLPESKVKVSQHFANFPDHIESMTIEDACSYFIGKLTQLVDDARDYFIGTATKAPLRKRAHLRVIK
jgi:hypothetical protein